MELGREGSVYQLYEFLALVQHILQIRKVKKEISCRRTTQQDVANRGNVLLLQLRACVPRAMMQKLLRTSVLQGAIMNFLPELPIEL